MPVSHAGHLAQKCPQPVPIYSVHEWLASPPELPLMCHFLSPSQNKLANVTRGSLISYRAEQTETRPALATFNTLDRNIQGLTFHWPIRFSCFLLSLLAYFIHEVLSYICSMDGKLTAAVQNSSLSIFSLLPRLSLPKGHTTPTDHLLVSSSTKLSTQQID